MIVHIGNPSLPRYLNHNSLFSFKNFLNGLLGETPNIAARLQGIAEPDGVVISAATHRLIAGLFACHDLGPQVLKGISTPLPAYRVLGESDIQSRFEAAIKMGLTPLVGRDHEVGLLQDRWEQAKAGAGQVVLVSGEPGIGKSRLVQELKEQVSAEGASPVKVGIFHDFAGSAVIYAASGVSHG